MDFTATGWAAQYTPSASDGVVWRPVEAWHPEHGAALVVDEATGRLVPATQPSGFQRLHRVGRVVTAIPAPRGWTLRIWENEKDDSSAFDVPIAALLVDDQGNLTPVGHSADSYLTSTGNQRSEIITPE